jgi:hypothetical protein
VVTTSREQALIGRVVFYSNRLSSVWGGRRKTGGNFPVEPVRPDARTGAVLTPNYGSIFETSMNQPV